MERVSVVVVAGGGPVHPAALADVPSGAIVIAADSGVDSAIALGLRVDVAVGDFDSVSADGLAAVEAAGARIERHPAAKEATDLELALTEALALGATDVVVLGVGDGRLDHLLAGTLALASPAWRSMRVTARLGTAQVHVLHAGDELRLHGQPGRLVTLVPVGGAARGVRTTGLVYALDTEDLAAATTRGVSNEFVGERATVTLSGGALLAVVPEDES